MSWPDPDDQTHEANILRALLRIDERMASVNKTLGGISFALIVIMVIAFGFAVERWKDSGWGW